MGAQQSTGSNTNSTNDNVAKTCYYEVLGVDRHATEDEIKKAYRRKALELHPDRNYGAVEAATAAFAEVSSAYEILSDPQERAWYDSHRESILRGDSNGVEEAGHDARFTSAAALSSLMGKFNARTPFTDGPTGFYGILSETFAQLAKEEDAACDWEGLEPVDYPEFGHSKDGYEDGVKEFYRVWVNFSTKKSFSWRNEYRASDAPDRQTRRLIEKENRRLRDEGIREFNDAVRSLVAFVRKRDPRFTPNSQTDEDRQKILRDAAAAQAARTRAANKAKLDTHTLPKWAQTQITDEQEGSFSSEEEEIVQQIECVVCNKVFKSEKQYDTHEKSKKHLKGVQQLQREMRLESKRLDLDGAGITTQTHKLNLKEDQENAHSSTESVRSENEITESISEIDEEPKTSSDHSPGPFEEEQPQNSPSVESSEDEGEYAPRSKVEERIASALDEGSWSTNEVTDGKVEVKVGKAKAKRAKKLARLEEAAFSTQEFKCAACNESFASKTKLFNHIKLEGHAEPVPKVSRKGKNKPR